MEQQVSSRALSFNTLGGDMTVDLWLAGGETTDAPIVIVAPALGVRASYYTALCQSLAGRGFSACSVDLPGSGASPIRAQASSDWGYADVIDHYWAAFTAARALYPKAPLYMLGHSVGGQVALMLAGREDTDLSGVLLVAAGTPWFGAWKGVGALRVRLGTQLIGMLTRMFGWYPGRQVGFGGREARTLMLQWVRAAQTNRFEGAGWSGEPLFANPGPPTLAIAVEGDHFAPEAAVRALTGKLSAREVELEHWRSPPEGVDHNRWPKHPEFIVDRFAAFVERSAG